MREWDKAPSHPIGTSPPNGVQLWVKGESAPQRWLRENVTYDTTGIYLRRLVMPHEHSTAFYPHVYSTMFSTRATGMCWRVNPWTSVESVAWYEL